MLLALPLLAWSAEPTLRGTGDLGVIIERGAGRVLIVNTSSNSIISRVEGLGRPVPRLGGVLARSSVTPTCSGATAG